MKFKVNKMELIDYSEVGVPVIVKETDKTFNVVVNLSDDDQTLKIFIGEV